MERPGYFRTASVIALLCLLVLACDVSGFLQTPTPWPTAAAVTATPEVTTLATQAAAASPTPGTAIGQTPPPSTATPLVSAEDSAGSLPELLSPADGSHVVLPTFEWVPVAGVREYRLQVAADPAFNKVDFEYETRYARLTPKRAIPNGEFYWRVEVIAADGSAGVFCAPWHFTKGIDPPQLTAPLDGEVVVLPDFSWNPAAGAVAYQVDISADPTFNRVDDTYVTFAARLTPKRTIAAGQTHWRVRGLDARDNPGTHSATGSFVKTMGAPALLSPLSAAGIVLPTLEWQAVSGASAYEVELSTDASFNQIDLVLVTGNTRLTPKKALPPGNWYWRVRAVDAGKHPGDASAVGEFVLVAGAPPALPYSPADGAVLTVDPDFSWPPVPGADSYRLEVHTAATFNKGYDTVQTDYVAYTPYSRGGDRPVYANGTYFWRVEARNKQGKVIFTGPAFSFTKGATLPLQEPSDGQTTSLAPTFAWSEVQGAESYRLMVHTRPTFDKGYDVVELEYPLYTPYGEGGDRITYADGTYFWMVEARNPSGQAICRSEARRVIRQTPLALTGPTDGSAAGDPPTFSWLPVPGARSYRLIVATDSAFKSTFDSVATDYTTYTPYGQGGDRTTYEAGTYFWQVEALNKQGQRICTSPAWSFTY